MLFHVDESADDVLHVHAGVLVPMTIAADASAALEKVVSDASWASICPFDAELHGQELVAGTGDWAKATIEQRIEIYRRSLAVLADYDIEVIAHGANIPAVKGRYGDEFKPHRWEFTNLLERLNERMKVRDEYAVVIADQHEELRDRLQRDVIDGRRYGTGGYRNQKLSRIIETAHFVDSKLSRLTQLADLVAYILRRRRSVPTEKDLRAEAANAELYQMAYDSVPGGQYWVVRY